MDDGLLSTPGWRRLLRLAGGSAAPELLSGLTEAGWADFLRQCNQHWLTPLAYQVLRDAGARPSVPSAIWRGFRRAYLLSRRRTLRSDRLALPLLSGLREAGVPVILLKGMHLSNQIYTDPATRPMMDIDLLVRREDLAATVRVVEALGYSQDPGVLPFPVKPWKHAREDCHHLSPFFHPAGPPIEIHHDLEVPAVMPDIDLDGVWQRAQPLAVGGTGALALAPEDALLHLCLHAAAHHEFGLKLLNLADIPRALDRWRDRIDWPAFWNRARQWGAERSAIITLAMVADRLGCTLPDAAARPIRAQEKELAGLMDIAEQQMRLKAATLARRRLKHGRPLHPLPEQSVALTKLARIPTWRGRLGLILRRAFVPRIELAHWAGVQGQPVWLPMLYPAYLAAFVGRHGRRALMRMAGPRGPASETLPPAAEADRRRLAVWLRAG